MKYIVCGLLLGVAAVLAPVGAQTSVVPDAAVAPPAAPAVAGIQSQNIFQVKPDARAATNYADQTNGQSGQLQPGHHTPLWPPVGQGLT